MFFCNLIICNVKLVKLLVYKVRPLYDMRKEKINRTFLSCFKPHYKCEAKFKVLTMKIGFHSQAKKTNFHTNSSTREKYPVLPVTGVAWVKLADFLKLGRKNMSKRALAPRTLRKILGHLNTTLTLTTHKRLTKALSVGEKH